MKRVLMVDDDEALRKLFAFLCRIPTKSLIPGDPKQALALALEYKPDANSTGFDDASINGFELCQSLKSLSTRL